MNNTFKEYVTALDNIKAAENKLMSTWASNIQDWENLENFLQNAEAIRERRNADIEALEKEVIVPMMTYKEQFAEIKGRIDKCESKRIDFDRCTHLIQKLEASAGNSSEKLETAKFRAGKSKDAYEAMVSELSSELPELYGARREFFATNLQNLFLLQKCFHNDVSFIFRDMSEYVLVKLKND